jgi:mRNA interferase RelE/StbE
MYRLQIQDRAAKDLRSLDKAVARRIVSRLTWLAENIGSVKRESLAGEFSDFHKFRVGDYRILYHTLDERQVVVIHRIGHRREIYRGR